MLRKLFDIIKKIIISVLLIYAYNKLSLPLDIVIPINILTILFVYSCGIPSIVCLSVLIRLIS